MFNDFPLIHREPIKLIHQFIDLLIRRRNLPLDHCLLLFGPGLVMCILNSQSSKKDDYFFILTHPETA